MLPLIILVLSDVERLLEQIVGFLDYGATDLLFNVLVPTVASSEGSWGAKNRRKPPRIGHLLHFLQPGRHFAGDSLDLAGLVDPIRRRIGQVQVDFSQGHGLEG